MKKILKGLVGAFVFIITILFVSSCSKGGDNSSTTTTTTGDRIVEAARAIKVVQIDGKASVTDEIETIDCFKGMNLYDGDTLNVLDDSVLVVRFDADKYVYLGENTTINIKSEGSDKFKTNVYVTKGLVLAEIQNKLGEDEEFFLSSNNSVMAVRGTVFGVKVKDTGENIIETYSVYQGVTELTVFDKLGDKIINGKLSDISNSKIELIVPKTHLLSEDETKQYADNWLKDINEKFEDPTDANSKLDEVEITVSKPSKEDYQQVLDTISEQTVVTHSQIEYTAEGYFGSYDGKAHKINIETTTENAKVYYKSETSEAYQEENTFEYTAPGTYRVYYKIECEGLDTKEDYEVIQISKADLVVTTTEELDGFDGYIAGSDLTDIINYLYDIVTVSGVDSDATEITNLTFESDEILKAGKNSYNINIVLPDTIKDNYNQKTITVTVTAYALQFAGSDAISDGLLNFNYISQFNRYNGVALTQLFNNADFTAGTESFAYNDLSFDYDAKVEGFYELKEGDNTVTVNVISDEGTFSVDVSFFVADYRTDITLDVTENTNTKIYSDTFIWYNTSNATGGGLVDNVYNITYATLMEQLGFANEQYVYVNLPEEATTQEVAQNNFTTYYPNQILKFAYGVASPLEILKFPTSFEHGIINRYDIYFSDTEPTDLPSYTISDNLLFAPNQTISFVESDSTVVYSVDGENYLEDLKIAENGEYEIYYKVGTNLIITGSQIVTVKNGDIYSENLEYLTNGTLLYSSNDNQATFDIVNIEVGNNVKGYITSNEANNVVSSPEDVYKVYSNLVKNSIYYDSITNSVIETTAEVSEMVGSSPNFTYKISAEGYDTVEGEFNIRGTYFGQLKSNSFYYSFSTEVINPVDYTISITESNDVSPNRIAFSLEDYNFINYDCYYSADNGKTWSDVPPSLTEVGTYDIYIMYDFKDANYDAYLEDPKNNQLLFSGLNSAHNYIIAIQTITITE